MNISKYFIKILSYQDIIIVKILYHITCLNLKLFSKEEIYVSILKICIFIDTKICHMNRIF